MACDVLIVGSGPLPNPDVNLTCLYQLRTAKLARHLAERGLETRLVAVDLLRSPEEWFSKERDSLVGRYRLLPQTDAGRGQVAFKKHCSSCHRVGAEGALIGPQLDGIGNRGLERVLEDVLDPNRNIDAAFHTTVLALDEKADCFAALPEEDG